MLCYIPTIGHSKIYFWLITDRVSEEGIKFGRVRPFVCNFVSARTAWPPDRRPWCFCVCIGRDHDDRSSPGIANPGRRSTLGVSKDGNAVGRSILELDRRQFFWLIGLIYCVIILTVLHNQALTFSVDIISTSVLRSSSGPQGPYRLWNLKPPLYLRRKMAAGK